MSSKYRMGRGGHFAQVPFALMDDDRADAYTISTYAALRSFADFGSDEGAEVSDATACARAGCSRRTLLDRRDRLRDMGWVEWDSGKENGDLNVYVIHGTPPGGVQEMRRGCAGDAQGGTREMHTTESHVTESHDRQSLSPDGDDEEAGRADELPPPMRKLPRNGPQGHRVYPDAFEEVWSRYPDRHRQDAKGEGYKKWRARLREGFAEDELLRAADEYRTYCNREGKTGTEVVMMMRTFFGPADRWQEWLPDEKEAARRKREMLREMGYTV